MVCKRKSDTIFQRARGTARVMISKFDQKNNLEAVTYPEVSEGLGTRTTASTIVERRAKTNTKAMEKVTRMVLNKEVTNRKSRKGLL